MYIAHISDINIDINNINTINKSKAVVNKINSLAIKPKYVVITGDIVEENNKKHFYKFFEIINQLKAPYFIVAGNHEAWQNFNEEIDEYCFFHPKSEVLSGIQYVKEFSDHILLTIDNSNCAFLSKEDDEEKLDWLENILKNNSKPVVIAMHKFPMLINIDFFDNDVKNVENKLAKMLEKYKENIKIVLCGHVHNNISSNIAGIPVIATFSNVFSYNLKFETTELCRRNFSSSSFHLHYFNGENFISYTIPFEEE